MTDRSLSYTYFDLLLCANHFIPFDSMEEGSPVPGADLQGALNMIKLIIIYVK